MRNETTFTYYPKQCPKGQIVFHMVTLKDLIQLAKYSEPI